MSTRSLPSRQPSERDAIIMDALEIPATTRTPQVSFNFPEHRFRLIGESYPEDVTRFYYPLFDALDAYLQASPTHCRFDFELIYFNSSSAKAIMLLMDKLDQAASRGCRVDVYWFHDPEDDTMEELGVDFGEDLREVNFRLERMVV
ncbi:DUF1987 domain-containing protein [Granulosicoccus sp. 3-233]|uniref:DUF1987 domain-containing protein n=1 Tax=Granulosicoccus sp. 3-233 TaxID=3417969 RepID=UPI003D34CAB1